LEEQIGKKMDNFVPEPNWPETRIMINKVTTLGESFSGLETRRYTKEGNILDISISGSCYRDHEGNVAASVINLRDITEQKFAEEALRQSEDRYRTIVETASGSGQAIVLVQDTDQVEAVCVFANDATSDITGYSKDELAQMSWLDIVHPLYQDSAKDRYRRRMRGEIIGDLFEITILSKGGTEVSIEVASIATEFQGKDALVVLFRDISERREAEEALRKSEEKYRLLIENATDAIFIAQDEVLKFANPKAEEMIGYSAEELAKISFVDIIHPEDRDMVLGRHMKRLKGEELSRIYSFRILNRSGEELSVEINAVVITWEGRPATLSFLRDITAQKSLEAQLQQSNKMEAIAILAGGVAHEFNNALMGIMGNIELLRMDLPEDERRDKFFETMKTAGHRMSRLTDQLLAYAQGGKYQPKDLKFNDFVIETLPILQHDLSPTVRVETHFPKDISYIRADNAQMQMVLSVILNNSNEAIEDEGLIRITAENKDVDEDFTKQHPGLKPGPYVCLTIEDDGKGMDEETRNGIFEPFFTTKFQGRGMGMAAVYGIVKNHDGWIYVDSELGKGTTVRIYLPAIEIEIEKPKKAKVEVATGS